MALKAASSITAYAGPCGTIHERPKTGEFIVDCPDCVVSLRGHELWGPADQPAPLTSDEARVLQSQQADANRSMLQGLAQLPDVLQSLVAMIGAQQSGVTPAPAPAPRPSTRNPRR